MGLYGNLSKTENHRLHWRNLANRTRRENRRFSISAKIEKPNQKLAKSAKPKIPKLPSRYLWDRSFIMRWGGAGGIWGAGHVKKKWLLRGAIPKILGEKRGKWHNLFILKTCHRRNIVDGVQSYYKLSFC